MIESKPRNANERHEGKPPPQEHGGCSSGRKERESDERWKGLAEPTEANCRRNLRSKRVAYKAERGNEKMRKTVTQGKWSRVNRWTTLETEISPKEEPERGGDANRPRNRKGTSQSTLEGRPRERKWAGSTQTIESHEKEKEPGQKKKKRVESQKKETQRKKNKTAVSTWPRATLAKAVYTPEVTRQNTIRTVQKVKRTQEIEGVGKQAKIQK